MRDWLIWKKNKVKASSFKRYGEKVNVINEYLQKNNLENISLKRFDYNILNKFLMHIQEKSSNVSYNYYLSIFVNLYKFLINIQVLNVDNISKRIEKLKELDTEKHAKYADIDRAFSDLVEYNNVLALMAKTIYYTLHRIETITSLQYKDFDFENGIINIPSVKIKTGKKLTIRISKHLLPQLKQYVKLHPPHSNDYFFGNNGVIKTVKNVKKTDIQIFGKNKTKVAIFTQMFTQFRKKKSTNKELFTLNHSLYTMKHNGVIYYKNVGLSDHQIIKITGHSNISILATYSKQYEAVISEELFNSLP